MSAPDPDLSSVSFSSSAPDVVLQVKHGAWSLAHTLKVQWRLPGGPWVDGQSTQVTLDATAGDELEDGVWTATVMTFPDFGLPMEAQVQQLALTGEAVHPLHHAGYHTPDARTALANMALAHIGTVSLADYNEGSPEAVQVRREWEGTRDALLRRRPWNFAIKRATLSLKGQVRIDTPLTLDLTGCATVMDDRLVTCHSTVNLPLGASVTGSGIPSGAVVTSVVDETRFTLSQAPQNTASDLTLTAALPMTTMGGTVVVCANTAGLAAGMSVTGPGLDVSTRITVVTDGTHFAISRPAGLTQVRAVLNASVAPPFGWNFAYVLPEDYLMALSFNEGIAGTGEAEFEIEGGLLLCQQPAKAELRYVFRQCDHTQWDQSFAEVFALRLASKIATGLTTAISLAAQLDQRAEQALSTAAGLNSQETRPRSISAQSDSGWMRARTGFSW